MASPHQPPATKPGSPSAMPTVADVGTDNSHLCLRLLRILWRLRKPCSAHMVSDFPPSLSMSFFCPSPLSSWSLSYCVSLSQSLSPHRFLSLSLSPTLISVLCHSSLLPSLPHCLFTVTNCPVCPGHRTFCTITRKVPGKQVTCSPHSALLQSLCSSPNQPDYPASQCFIFSVFLLIGLISASFNNFVRSSPGSQSSQKRPTFCLGAGWFQPHHLGCPPAPHPTPSLAGKLAL